MKHQTIHQISVRARPEQVFELCERVADWPEIFEPCRKACVLEETADQQLIRITAEANGTPMTWESARSLDRVNQVIRFRQTKPQWPVVGMEGAWELGASAPDQTLITLRHTLEVDGQDPNHDEHASRMLRAIHRNSEAELSALRKRAECQPALSFSDRRLIPATARAVYDALYRAEQWPHLLPHCPGMDVLYDDGRYQELRMRVQTPHGPEEIRTIRMGTPPEEIRYFQPAPPAPLAIHTGSWQVRYPLPEGVELIAAHSIRIRGDLAQHPDETRSELERVASAIRSNTRATLDALADHFASQEP